MIKNYTSSISAQKSIAFIELQLAKNKAKQVLKDFDCDGRVTSIWFKIEINGTDINFKLPAKVSACESILRQNLGPMTRPETRKKIGEQAERTAWKILSDWVEAQMAMIELAQVDFMEVFLPYAFDPATQKTAYEMAQDTQFKKLLTAGK